MCLRTPERRSTPTEPPWSSGPADSGASHRRGLQFALAWSRVSTYVAVFALVLAYVATVAAYCALRTLAKLRRDTHLLSRGTRGPGRSAVA